MSTTAARRRRASALVRPLLVLALLAGGSTAALLTRERGPDPSAICTPPEACVAALDGGETLVSTRPSAASDAYLEPAADGSVSLVGLDGRRRWRVSTGSAAAPQLVAAG